MWSILLPLLIKLAREWIDEGKVSKANVKVTAEAILSGIESAEGWDLEVLGKNMVIQGLAFQQMARNLKVKEIDFVDPPDKYKVQPLRPPGTEKTCVRNPEKTCDECMACCG